MARPRRRSNVIARVVAGEMVVLDPERRVIHQLNATATFIWDRCHGEAEVATIAAELARAYGLEAERATRDVSTALACFEALGLLEPSFPGGEPPAASVS
jgi:hypothetical protein